MRELVFTLLQLKLLTRFVLDVDEAFLVDVKVVDRVEAVPVAPRQSGHAPLSGLLLVGEHSLGFGVGLRVCALLRALTLSGTLASRCWCWCRVV